MNSETNQQESALEAEYARGFDDGYKQAVHDAIDAIGDPANAIRFLLIEPSRVDYVEDDVVESVHRFQK